MSKPYIAPTAVVLGDVRIGEDSSVWFHTTIRADEEVITIGKGTNIQDNSVLHLDPGGSITIGDYVTVGHSAIVHGCTVGDNTIIGMGSIIMNGAVIGKNCIIGAGALVTEGKIIPDGSVVMGSPAKVVRQVNDEDINKIRINAAVYVKEAEKYRNKSLTTE